MQQVEDNLKNQNYLVFEVYDFEGVDLLYIHLHAVLPEDL